MSQPKILYVGPLADFSGYATAARDYVRALDSVGCNLVTRCLSYDGGSHNFSEREKELLSKETQGIDIVIQHTTPNETERKNGLFNVNYFAWETDRVPNEWVEKINTMDLALVPCDENIKSARKSGVVIPIHKIQHTFDASKYVKMSPYNIPQSGDKMKILSVCQISKKKGLDALLKAYLSEFRSFDNVILVLKVYFGPADTEQHKQKMLEQIEKIKELLRIGDYAPVYLVHGVMSEDAITRLYNTSDVYCLPSRGEGWGIPLFDAMGHGLPVICIGWGGPKEFVTKDHGWLVDYHMSPCFDMPHPHNFMYTGLDNWAEPNIDSLRAALRTAHSEWAIDKSGLVNNSAWQQKKSACKARVLDFSYERVGTEMKEIIYHYYNRWKS